MGTNTYSGGPVRFRPPVCHSCRLDLKRVRKAEEWEDKYSERNIAKDDLTCTRCHQVRTWWWFCFLPITAEEIVRFLARADARKAGKLAEHEQTVQLED